VNRYSFFSLAINSLLPDFQSGSLLFYTTMTDLIPNSPYPNKNRKSE